jgi:hypothetical protein
MSLLPDVLVSVLDGAPDGFWLGADIFGLLLRGTAELGLLGLAGTWYGTCREVCFAMA